MIHLIHSLCTIYIMYNIRLYLRYNIIYSKVQCDIKDKPIGERPLKRKGEPGLPGTSSSSESESESQESEVEASRSGTRRMVQPEGSERRRSLNAWMQARSAQRGGLRS